MTGGESIAGELHSTIIRNSTVYAPTELFEVYKDFLGRPVTEHTAKHIAEAVQQKYVDDGFTRPGYKILDGGEQTRIIRVSLVEPSISRVEFAGDAGPYQLKLQDLFGELPASGALRPDRIRGALNAARRLPGLKITASTERDGDRSAAFVLKIESAFSPVEANVKVSNRGTREIGRELLFARLVGNGLFRQENAAGVFLATAKDSDKYRSGGIYTIGALGERGTSAQLQGSYTSIHIESSGVQVEQTRDLYSLKISHPLDGSLMGDARVWGALEIDNFDVYQDGVINREDRLRSVELGVTTSRRAGTALRQLSLEVEQGLTILGGRLRDFSNTDDARRPDFTIVQLQYLQSVRLDDSWTFRCDGYAQYSAEVLPSIKRFKVGGNRIGRGFEAAAVSGDRGVGGKIELRRRLSDEPNWLGRASAYGFYDLGAAWKNDLGGRESAASTGAGMAFRGERLTGYFEIAKPLTHADADGKRDAGIFAELSYQF